MLSQPQSLTPPPTDWKAITYFPRYHSFWRMLYEWDDYDSRLGKTVSAAVDDDMNILAASGVNVLHTYIWDQALLTSAVKGRWCTDRNNADPKLRGRYFANCTSPYNERGGFASAPFNPSFSLQRNNVRTQLIALDEFITKAEQHGLFVLIHFASGRLIAGTSGMCIDMVGGGVQCDPDYPFLPNLSPNPAYNGKTSQTVAQEHNAWINAFVSYLGRTPIVYYVNGQYYYGQTVPTSAYSILSIQGKGFSFYPFSSFQFTRPGYSNVLACQGDGYSFYADAFFVYTGPGGRLAPGLWTVILYNGHGAQISIPINVY